MKYISLKKLICTVLAAAIAASPVYTAQMSPNFHAAAYEAQSVTITPEVTNGSVIGQKLNEALLEAAALADDDSIVTVKLPEGRYILDEALHIYSNTTLDVIGCTLESDANKHNFFILGTNSSYMGVEKYNSSAVSSGYSSVKNVKVLGGVWVGNDSNTNTPIRLAHASNVTFEGMTVRGSNMSTHQVEAAGIDGLYIRGCTFCDFTPLNNMSGHFEAIQLDIPINTAIYNSSYLDGTPNKNVEITGCTFSNVSRGVGTHSMLVGAYHQNIKITGNTFVNVQEEAIVALNYIDCTITGNKIINAGGGIIFESAKFKPSSGDRISSMHTTIFDGQQLYEGETIYDANSVISDNDIGVCYSPLCSRIIGIRIHGLDLEGQQYVGGDYMPLPKENFYISGVTVSNNKISTAGGGILIDDARDIVCTSNTIAQQGVSSADSSRDSYDGIYITSASKNISVANNGVSGFTRYGILFTSQSSAKDITGNTVSGCGRHGIYLTGSSVSNGEIKLNTIKNCSMSGIVLNSSSSAAKGISSNSIISCSSNGVMLVNSKASSISSNTVNSCLANGIYINSSSTVSGAVAKNSIMLSGGSGIYINSSSSAGSVSSNVVTSPAKHGILIYSSGKVTGAVTKNTISSPKQNGILLDTKSSAGSISSNKLSACGKNGISVYSGSAVSGSIMSNTISSPKQSGILIDSKSKAGSILSNKITGSGKNGIFLYTSSMVVSGISSNTISSPSKNGILLDTGSKAGEIKQNKISSSGNNGIYLYSKSAVNGSISGNTVKSSKASGIVLNLSSSAGSIASNTVNTSGKNGIFLYSSSKVTGNMQSNTIKASKQSGIILDKKCSVKSIASNTITSSGTNAIALAAKSKVNASIKKNTINTAKTGIAADKTSTVKNKITDNTFKKISGKKTDIK